MAKGRKKERQPPPITGCGFLDGVIVGSNPGSKLDDAIRLGVPVIRENKAKEMSLI